MEHKMHHEHVEHHLKMHDGGMKDTKHHHEHVEKHLKEHDGGMHGHKHHHEHVKAMCMGGKTK